MSGLFSRMFGGGKKKNVAGDSKSIEIVESQMAELLKIGNLDLDFEVEEGQISDEGFENLYVTLSGDDEDLLTEKDGALLDALQLYIKRVVQHNLPDAKVNVHLDANDYREKANQSLVELAEKLKETALAKGKTVYFRALPPKDRKVIHQYLAQDDRIRSKSIGEGLFKKIKIYPIKGGAAKVAAP